MVSYRPYRPCPSLQSRIFFPFLRSVHSLWIQRHRPAAVSNLPVPMIVAVSIRVGEGGHLEAVARTVRRTPGPYDFLGPNLMRLQSVVASQLCCRLVLFPPSSHRRPFRILRVTRMSLRSLDRLEPVLHTNAAQSWKGP